MNFGTLFGDNDLENMFQRIDTLSQSVSNSAKRSDPDITDAALREMLKVIQTDNNETSSTNNDINSLFNKLSISNSRISRYKTYDEIYRNVSILKRILSVYITNVLQIDVLTNAFFQVKNKKTVDAADTANVEFNTFATGFIKHFKLEQRVKHEVLPHLLRYGDHFIEIINIDEDVVDFRPITQHLITENFTNQLNEQILLYSSSSEQRYNKQTAYNNLVESLYKSFINMDNISSVDDDVGTSLLFESKNINPDKSDAINRLNRVFLRFHNPHKISILRTKQGSVLGYVEIFSEQQKNISSGVTAQFAQVINAMGSTNKTDQDNSVIVKGIINKIISNLISKIEIPKSDGSSDGKKIPEKEILKSYENSIKTELGDDLFALVKQLFIEVNDTSRTIKQLNVRFISKDRMTHMCHNPIEYSPYGTSILDSLVYPAKLYMLTQLSNVINKLSRASLIRKWTLNKIGALCSNAY